MSRRGWERERGNVARLKGGGREAGWCDCDCDCEAAESEGVGMV